VVSPEAEYSARLRRDLVLIGWAMLFRSIVSYLLLAVLFAGCQTPDDKKEKKEAAAKKALEKANKKDSKPSIPDANDDMLFQSFLGRLRLAVQNKDRVVITSMMDANFGWRWDTPPAGETAFDYWEQNNLWGELSSLLSERFVPHENYMVAPPKFVTDSSYKGYRVGLRTANGTWKFAYFITGEDVLQ
jgi:hypothetical protein